MRAWTCTSSSSERRCVASLAAWWSVHRLSLAHEEWDTYGSLYFREFDIFDKCAHNQGTKANFESLHPLQVKVVVCKFWKHFSFAFLQFPTCMGAVMIDKVTFRSKLRHARLFYAMVLFFSFTTPLGVQSIYCFGFNHCLSRILNYAARGGGYGCIFFTPTLRISARALC